MVYSFSLLLLLGVTCSTPGGQSTLYQRIAYPWGNCYSTGSILYFMMFNTPAAVQVNTRCLAPFGLIFSSVGLVSSLSHEYA